MHFHCGTAQKTGRQAVDNAVDVVEREHVDEVIGWTILPCFNETARLELDDFVRAHASLGVACCSRGIDHKGAAVEGECGDERGQGGRVIAAERVKAQEWDIRGAPLTQCWSQSLEGRVDEDQRRV